VNFYWIHDLDKRLIEKTQDAMRHHQDQEKERVAQSFAPMSDAIDDQMENSDEDNEDNEDQEEEEEEEEEGAGFDPTSFVEVRHTTVAERQEAENLAATQNYILEDMLVMDADSGSKRPRSASRSVSSLLAHSMPPTTPTLTADESDNEDIGIPRTRTRNPTINPQLPKMPPTWLHAWISLRGKTLS